MSTLDRVKETPARLHTVRATAVRAVVGDTHGLALFFGGLVFFGLYWRMGAFITDTHAIMNTLVNVADGRLAVVEAPYGAGTEAPGTYVSGGEFYGRNYGVVVAATPVLWALEGVHPVLDVRVVLAGLWSLLVVGFTGSLGRAIRREWIQAVGAALAVVLFVLNVAAATPVDPRSFPILALQVVTMVAAALTGVVMYRLVALSETRQVALFAGVGTVLATPVAFWASLPKRHAFTALFVVGTAYGLARSRRDESPWTRAFAYVCVGLLAWVHAAEAVLVVVPLVVLDLATAPTNDRRTLGVVAGAFLLSLVPSLLTNVAISGNPLRPPRMLSYSVPVSAEPDLSGASGSGGGGTDGGSWSLRSLPLVGQMLAIAGTFVTLLWDGFVTVLSQPERLGPTFLRSGHISGVAEKDNLEAISLTVLESAPLLGGIVGAPVAVGAWLRESDPRGVRRYLSGPSGVTDVFFGGVAVLFVLLYIDRLPLHAQVTVRYLHPLFPIGIYALCRLPPVRHVIETRWRLVGWTTAAVVLIGGQVVVGYVALAALGQGEAVQVHALLGLTAAVLLGAWVLVSTLTDRTPGAAGAVALGVASGTGIVFVLLTGWFYFDFAGEFALPIARVLSETVALT